MSGNTASGNSTPVKSVTGRLTVNAAFLKEIKDDNRHLKELWDRLIPMLSHGETAKNHWSELIDGLACLRDQLALHFSLEEAYGYFEEAIDAAPHLSLKAEALRGEHADLFSQVRDLADAIVDVDSERMEKLEKFLARFDRFRRGFERHEEEELRLILQSFDDDIGVGD
ncbi:hemerythrin domain-containing protein [Roseiconus nitratireducens]|uniref:Hemerythrin domain-containing protein n=1 Tax=Roseiconus nitratireducens TaxID=2605748 RepID=A0A5M6CXS3_9BACT|nr:hemerythrin domain-containing protein [Roseiconus nitratireducens]KAA5540014.1 hemerythrin domain-containing protein [Roseiconus nitratireducens]